MTLICLILFFIDFFSPHTDITDAIVYRNGNNGHAMHKSDSLEEDLQRAISTAERRKVNSLKNIEMMYTFVMTFQIQLKNR